MFRRPPSLSTRVEDTYDYLTDELDERHQVLVSSLFVSIKTNPPIMMVAGGELGRASGVGDRAATSVKPGFSTNAIAEASFYPGQLNIYIFEDYQTKFV